MPAKINANDVKNLTDDQLCAIVARNEVRKLGHTPHSNPSLFGSVFHEYSDIKKGVSEDQAAKLERARRKKLVSYLVENFGITVVKGQLVGTIITE